MEDERPQVQAVSPVALKEDAQPRPGSRPEDDDDSSLTSLSDIEERLVLVTPQPARAQPQNPTSSRKTAPPRKRQSTASTATSHASLSSAGKSDYRPGLRVASGLVASPDSSDSEASDDDEYRPAMGGGRGRGGAVLRKRATRSQGPGSATKSRSSATTPARTRKQAEEQAAQSPAPSISTTKRTKTDSEAPRTVTSPASTLNAAAPVPAPPPVSPRVMTCIRMLDASSATTGFREHPLMLSKRNQLYLNSAATFARARCRLWLRCMSIVIEYCARPGSKRQEVCPRERWLYSSVY